MIKKLILASYILIVAGCNSISPYNQKAYENATSVKAHSLLLIDKAVEPYDSHKEEAETLKLEIEKAYEYSKGRPVNDDSTKMWEIIRDPKRNSMGNFLIYWKDKKQLLPDFVTEKKDFLSKHFDVIIKLEESKSK